MSISSEITRLSGNVSAAFTAITNKGVTVPSGSTSDDLATLIGQIQTGGGSGGMTVTETSDPAGGTVLEITGVNLSSDTVTAGSMLSGVTAHDSSGTAITGNIATKTASDLTALGDTVTVPAGYYASQATKSVASGTAGTPTATKGTVSNHSISVTPSVTNTSGYISGSTINGTSVSVSASELVSGSQTITTNNTYDVTNLASVVVNVAGSSASVDTKTLQVSENTSTSISFTGMKGTPIAWFLSTNTQMTSGSSTYYYVINMRYNGSVVTGNCFRVGGTRRVEYITSGYSYSYSGTTLTLTTTGSRTSSPGSFCNVTYELIYVY